MGDLQQDKSDWEDDEKNRSIKAEDSGIFPEEMPQYSYLIEEFIQKNR